MNLVRAIFEPAPPPVIVERIPEYYYVYYAGEYIPYFEGWLFVDDAWHWAETGHRPPKPPAWTPPPRPRHQAPPHHKVIALPDHHFGHGFGHEPAPVFRHEGKRPEPPRTAVVRPERKEKEKATAKPEPKKTEAKLAQKEKEKATAKPEPKKTEAKLAQKEKATAKPEPPRTAVVRPERKEKEKVTVQPDRRHDAPPKKGR